MDEKKVIIEIDIKAGEAIVEIEKLRLAIKEQQAIMNAYKKSPDSDQYKNAAIEVRKYKEQLSILTKSTNQYIKETNAKKGSMEKLSLELGRNRAEYRKLELQEAQNTDKGKKLLATIQQQDARIKQLDATLGNHQRNVGNYQTALQGLGNQFMTIFSAAGLANLATQTFQRVIGGVKDYLNEASAAFQESEKSTKQLEFAVREIAGDDKSAFKVLMKQAQDLSSNKNYSIFADDAIQKTQQLGIELGLSTSQVKQLMPQIIDVASAMGIDLSTAMEKVVKGINGQTKGLKSMGINFKDTGSTAENFNIITEQLTKFQGSAAVALNTTSGALQKQKNDLEETQEVMGRYTTQLDIWWSKAKGMVAKAIVVNVEAMSDAVSGFQESTAKSNEKLNENKQSVVSVIEQYSKLTGQTKEAVAVTMEMTGSLSKANQFYNDMVKFINKNNVAKKEETKLTEEQIKANEKAAEEQKKRLSELESLRIQLIQDTQEKEIALENKRYNDYVAQWGELEGAYEVHMQNLIAIDRSYNDLKKVESIKVEQEIQDAFLETRTVKTDAYKEENKAFEEQQKQAEAQLAAIQQYSEQLTGIVSSSIDENGLNLKKFGQSLSVFILDILKKQSEAAVAAAFVGSMATPASIGTGGIAGVVQAGILTALIEAAFAAAKGIITQPVQGLATGTTQVIQGGQFLVGEQGPELVNLPKGAAVVPNSLLDFKNFGNFAAPQMAGNEAQLIQAIKEIQIWASIQDINAVAKSESKRIKISKI